MRVTKFFKIDIDELGAEFLNAPGLKLLLDATLIDEKAEDSYLHIDVEDITDKKISFHDMYDIQPSLEEMEDYEILEDKEEVIENHGPHDDSGESIQEKNERLRLKNEKEVGPPHNAPGKGTPCVKPEIFKDTLREGGSISFCPACGHQYKDTDLTQ